MSDAQGFWRRPTPEARAVPEARPASEGRPVPEARPTPDGPPVPDIPPAARAQSPIDITPAPNLERPDPDIWISGAGRLHDQDAEHHGESGKLSRRRLILLGSALVVGLAGAAVIGAAGWRVVSQQDARLATPVRIAELTRDDSQRARETADYLRTGFAADIELDDSIGAVYADPTDNDRSVLLFGGTTLLWQPEHDLDNLFDLVADDAGAITGLHEVPAGDLGGVMKCGTTPAGDGGGDLAVCGWADHGSVAMAMFPGRGVAESAALLRDIRQAVQTRD
jgi:cell division protein FtsB